MSILPESLNIKSIETDKAHYLALERLQRADRKTEELKVTDRYFLIKLNILTSLLGNEKEILHKDTPFYEQPIVPSIFRGIAKRIEGDADLEPIIEKLKKNLLDRKWEALSGKSKEITPRPIEPELAYVLSVFVFTLMRKYILNFGVDYYDKDLGADKRVTYLSQYVVNGRLIERDWETIENVFLSLSTEFQWQGSAKYSEIPADVRSYLNTREAFSLAREVFPYIPKLYLLYLINNQEELSRYNPFGYRHTFAIVPTFRAWLVEFLAKNSIPKDDIRFVDEDAQSQLGLDSARHWLTRVTTNNRNKPKDFKRKINFDRDR